MATKRYTIGRQLIKPFFCPWCGGITGEVQIGRDLDCAKNEHKESSLCYVCGFYNSSIVKGTVR